MGTAEKKVLALGILRQFGVGKKRTLTQKQVTCGVVQSVKKCWWLKVNQKPVRAHSLDGAAFPHRISFRYAVGEREYTASAYVSWNKRCPSPGETLVVYYDGERPERCALEL